MLLGGGSITAIEVSIPDIPYSVFALENGLKVYVVEDKSIPLVELTIYYKVGAIDEEKGLTGISHFLEHTMFLGTKALGKGQIDQLITGVGGHFNAVTSNDVTYYYSEVPSSMLELVVAMEADRMGNLVIDPIEVEREREVIRQERRSSIENNVFTAGLEQIQAAAFPNSSLNHQVIGWMDDINNITVDDLTRFYETYYAPNNAVMVVTGDVELDEVRELTQRYFGHYSSVEINRPEFLIEQQSEELKLEIKLHTNVPITAMLYPIPAGNHQDTMAINVFLNILVNNASSRIKQELQKMQNIILETGAFSLEMREPGFALIYVVPSSVELIDVAQNAFDTELARIISDGIDQVELDVVKKAVLKNLIFSQRESSTMATTIAIGSLRFDNPDFYQEQIRMLNELTVSDIIEIVQEYFTPENRTVGNIVPIN